MLRKQALWSVAAWLVLPAFSSAAAMAANEPTYSLKEAIAKCSAIENAEDRLGCYDTLAQASGAVPQKEAAANAADSGAASVTAATPQDESSASSAPTEKSKQNEQRYVVLSADDPKLQIHTNELDKHSSYYEGKAYDQTIIATKTNNVGVLFVAFENGELWRAIDAPRRGAPKRGTLAHLKPRLTGGWFVKFDDTDEQIRMRPFDLNYEQ